MLRTRIIPALLLHGKSLVKTERFGKFRYIGDPANTVRIFNELEVDELTFLDIKTCRTGSDPDFELLQNIATECFMPLSYGGGIRSFDAAKLIFDTGFEKVTLNSILAQKPQVLTDIAKIYGTQAVVASIDVKRSFWGSEKIATHGAKKMSSKDVVAWAKELEDRGAGEILLTAVDREGTWDGFDLDLIKRVTDAVDIPVIAHGGAGTLEDIGEAVHHAGASAVALGSMVVFQKKGMGVLVNFPQEDALNAVLTSHDT